MTINKIIIVIKIKIIKYFLEFKAVNILNIATK